MRKLALLAPFRTISYPWGTRRWVSVSPYAFCLHLPQLRGADLRLFERAEEIDVSDCDLVYATAVHAEHLRVLSGRPNVVVGGPASLRGSLEEHLGHPTSSTITRCWGDGDFVVISLGSGCVHGRCRYCSTRGEPLALRPNVPGILSQLQTHGETSYWLSIDGPPVWVVAEVIESKGPAFFTMYARPPELAEALELTSASNDRLHLSVGLEALSDRTLRYLARGHSVADSLRAVEAALRRKIRVVILLMGPHPGEEVEIDEFRRWYDRNRRQGLTLRWTGPTVTDHWTTGAVPTGDGWMRPVSQASAEKWARFVKNEMYSESADVRFKLLTGVRNEGSEE